MDKPFEKSIDDMHDFTFGPPFARILVNKSSEYVNFSHLCDKQIIKVHDCTLLCKHKTIRRFIHDFELYDCTLN